MLAFTTSVAVRFVADGNIDWLPHLLDEVEFDLMFKPHESEKTRYCA